MGRSLLGGIPASRTLAPARWVARCSAGYPPRGRSLLYMRRSLLGGIPASRTLAPGEHSTRFARSCRVLGTCVVCHDPGGAQAACSRRGPVGGGARARRAVVDRGSGAGIVAVAHARHQRRRREGAGHRRARRSAAQGAGCCRDRRRAGGQPERCRRPRKPRPVVTDQFEDDHVERLPGDRGGRLPGRLRRVGAGRRREAATRRRRLGHQLGREHRALRAAVRHGRRRPNRGSARDPGARRQPGCRQSPGLPDRRVARGRLAAAAPHGAARPAAAQADRDRRRRQPQRAHVHDGTRPRPGAGAARLDRPERS